MSGHIKKENLHLEIYRKAWKIGEFCQCECQCENPDMSYNISQSSETCTCV